MHTSTHTHRQLHTPGWDSSAQLGVWTIPIVIRTHYDMCATGQGPRGLPIQLDNWAALTACPGSRDPGACRDQQRHVPRRWVGGACSQMLQTRWRYMEEEKPVPIHTHTYIGGWSVSFPPDPDTRIQVMNPSEPELVYREVSRDGGSNPPCCLGFAS